MAEIEGVLTKGAGSPALNEITVALALAVVKSKPEGITIRDYIVHLRSHLRSGRQATATTTSLGRKHLDQVGFWKSRCDELEHKYRELQNDNVCLRRLNDSLQQRSNIDEYLGEETGGKKRKGKGSSVNKSSKRARISPSIAESSVTGSRGSFGGDLDNFDEHGEGGIFCELSTTANETAKEGDRLVQILYTTHMLYQKDSVDLRALSFNLIQTTRAIGSVIATIPRQYDRLTSKTHWSRPPHQKDKTDLAKVIEASARAFTSVLVGLGRLDDGSQDRLASLVVYECVLLFRVLIQSMTDSARLNAQTKSTTQTKNGTKSATVGKEAGAARTLAHFSNAIMSHLNKSNHHHREIFEGMLFVLIERIGKLLFYCTFEKHRAASVEGDITLPAVHDSKRAVFSEQVEATSIWLETRSIIVVLQRAVALAPHHLNAPLPSSSTTSGTRRTSSIAQIPTRASQAPLVVHARERLQRTLITCMFGEERDEFADVLRMPAALGPCPSLPKVDENDVGTWFNGEVWRLVGWDLLSHDDEW